MQSCQTHSHCLQPRCAKLSRICACTAGPLEFYTIKSRLELSVSPLQNVPISPPTPLMADNRRTISSSTNGMGSPPTQMEGMMKHKSLRLLLIRHAQSQANMSAETTITGRMNETPLTSLGKQQAIALAQRLQAEVTHVTHRVS
eukprot:g78820.t1